MVDTDLRLLAFSYLVFFVRMSAFFHTRTWFYVNSKGSGQAAVVFRIWLDLLVFSSSQHMHCAATRMFDILMRFGPATKPYRCQY